VPYKDPIKARDYKRQYQRIWKQKRRDAWLQENGPCQNEKCGSWEDLEVDHIDPRDKVDHRVWSWAKERREAELGKCRVLCKKCHKEKTRKNKEYTSWHYTKRKNDG
jgi:5-methylcytosine-specific restriction endonuclease McrA